MMRCIYVLLSLLVIVWGQNKKQRNRKPLGSYVCPANHVLAIYELELPYIIHLACVQPSVCDEKLSCTVSTCSSLPSLSFLQSVTETEKYDDLQTSCCTYGPEPNDYSQTNCRKYEVKDRLSDMVKNRMDRKEMTEEEEETELAKQLRDIHKEFRAVLRARRLRRGRRQKRQASPSTRRFGYAEVFRRKLPFPITQFLIVNDVKRIREAQRFDSLSKLSIFSNGYTVSGCEIQCERTTTTSTTITPPSTVKPEFEKETSVPKTHKEAAKTAEPAPISVSIAPCFSADGSVQTVNGSKRMDELNLYDEVLVSFDSAGPTYQPIEMWYHRVEDIETEFVVIQTENQELSLTPNHLIPIFDCDSEIDQAELLSYSVFASRAQPGRCIVTHSHGVLKSEKIQKVWREVKIGIFSPITEQGALFVDDVLVSCFTTLESHSAQHTLHNVIVKLYAIFEWFTGVCHTETVDIPLLMQILIRIASLIVPECMF